MTKNLRKAITKRSQLKTKYFKRNPAESLQLYKKQTIFCIKLHKKERKKYHNSLKLNKVTDNKAFWKTIKPFLSDKRTNINKITLVDNDNTISDDKQLCKTFTNFFQEAVKILPLSDQRKSSECKKDKQNCNYNINFSTDLEKSMGNLNSFLPKYKLSKIFLQNVLK